MDINHIKRNVSSSLYGANFPLRGILTVPVLAVSLSLEGKNYNCHSIIKAGHCVQAINLLCRLATESAARGGGRLLQGVVNWCRRGWWLGAVGVVWQVLQLLVAGSAGFGGQMCKGFVVRSCRDW